MIEEGDRAPLRLQMGGGGLGPSSHPSHSKALIHRQWLLFTQQSSSKRWKVKGETK